MSAKWWKFGTPREMIVLENRIDTLDMVYHIVRSIDDDTSIKAVITGLYSYYQKKYQTVKEENDRQIAKMVENYDKERPIICPEGEQ